MTEVSSEGMEALASGKFRVPLAPGEKGVYGIVDGHKVLLNWNTRGTNPEWKVEAVKAFKDQTTRNEKEDGNE